MSDQDRGENNRRNFLRASATVGAGAAASALLPGSALAESVPEDRPKAKARRGYQETAHVRDYYKSARF